jgi:predicted phage terminase large subunit-like protein
MGKDDLTRNFTTYMAVDFAISETERSDYTVMVVGGVDEEGQLYILDVVRARLDGMEIVDNLFGLAKRYSPDTITVEAGSIEKALGPFIRAEMFKPDKAFLNLNPMVPTKDKQSRARGIQARMRAGGVKFNKETDWYPQLESEMRQFPRAVHDDQVDAMAWLGLTLNKMVPAQTQQEAADEAYTMEVNLTMTKTGQHRWTGY